MTTGSKKSKSRGISLLRALAIVSVIIFHMSSRVLPGGFLGVDLFFVMSGYLAVTTAYERYRTEKQVSVKEYLLKKYKKLSPALYAMIIAVLVFLVLFNKYVLKTANLDALSGFTFTSNIWYIVKKVDYFDSFAINPFNHLWYLGVQFQLYIVFILLVKLIGFEKNKRIDLFSKVVFALFLASFLAHVAMFDIDNINRIYYGTDTRAFEFLLGVLVGRLLPVRFVEHNSTFFNKFKGLISIASIAVFILLTKYISQYSFWLYQGGFLLIAILSVVMLYSTSAFVRGKLNVLTDKTPLGFIGDMSYDLYIWHYPIIVLTQTEAELTSPNLTFTILRLIATFIVALVVKEFIVDSIDRYTVSGSIDRLVQRHKKRSLNARRATTFLGALLLILTGMGLFGQAMPYLSTAFVKERKQVKLDDSFVTKGNAKTSSKPIKDTAKDSKRQDKISLDQVIIGKANAKTGYIAIDNPKKDPTKLSIKENISQMKYRRLVLIGDSLAVNVGPALQEVFPETIADGKISRQLYNSASLVEQYASYDSKDTAFIFMLGTNGVFMEYHIDNLIAPLKESDVYFINIKLPQVHEKQVNDLLKAYSLKHYQQVSVIDWNKAAVNHPEYFEPDNTHLKKDGIDALIKIIFEKLNSK